MQEITWRKPPKELKLDSSGQGILVTVGLTSTARSVLSWTPWRRCVAFDPAWVLGYDLSEMGPEPLPAPATSFTWQVEGARGDAILRGDRQAFVRMQQLTTNGIKPRPGRSASCRPPKLPKLPIQNQRRSRHLGFTGRKEEAPIQVPGRRPSRTSGRRARRLPGRRATPNPTERVRHFPPKWQSHLLCLQNQWML